MNPYLLECLELLSVRMEGVNDLFMAYRDTEHNDTPALDALSNGFLQIEKELKEVLTKLNNKTEVCNG